MNQFLSKIASVSEEEMIMARDELTRAHQDLQQKTQRLEELQQAESAANEEYDQYPKMNAARLSTLALPVGGAVAGGMAAAKKFDVPGRTLGAMVGGTAGLIGAGVANAGITNHLNNKYPGRSEAFDAAQASMEEREEFEDGPHVGSQEWYDHLRTEAASLASRNPMLYNRATAGHEGYPAEDVQAEILAAKKQEQEEAIRAKMREEEEYRLALEEKKMQVASLGKGNELTDEEIAKQRYKNEQRIGKEASYFQEARSVLEKYAYEEADPYAELASLTGTVAGIGIPAALSVRDAGLAAGKEAVDVQPHGVLHPDVLDTIRASAEKAGRSEARANPLNDHLAKRVPHMVAGAIAGPLAGLGAYYGVKAGKDLLDKEASYRYFNQANHVFNDFMKK